MENQRETIEILLQNRVHLYQVLHTVFSGEPNEELIHQLASDATSLAFEILSEEDDDVMAKISRFGKKLEGKLEEIPAEGEPSFLEKIKSEYTKLLVGPGKLVAYPWESTYVGKETLLFQESTLRVRQFYRKYGYLPQNYPHVADDHISLELHFMAKLSERALQAFQQEDMETMRYLLEGQQIFMKYHLLNWIPQYAENMKKSKTTYMYPQFALAADAFIKVDNQFIQEAVEWIDASVDVK
ncbi:MAG: molecular chaperone TorD family protein [Lachnospiraceae bacterium]|nr:molecular chaperone TorD family protein [Lachnospiraceae bacterium]